MSRFHHRAQHSSEPAVRVATVLFHLQRGPTIMGGGPWKEHLLITLPIPEPTEEIARLKQRFPGIEIVYRQANTQGVPVELYKPATVLFTLFGTYPRTLPMLLQAQARMCLKYLGSISTPSL